ncbi:MAG TPA: hypothetical protein VIG48_11705, partial [Jatrophihabitans sp.]
MSAATELDWDYATAHPLYEAPAPARRSPQRLASVTTLHRLPAQAIAPQLRLTRRGVRVLAAALAVVAVGLVGLARASAPSAGAPARAVPDTVTVHAGDTLWSIAGRVAPQVDSSAEVAELQQLN